MIKKLAIFINDQIAYEHDRESSLEEQKLVFLDNMDADMERGIKIQGELIISPDKQQRAKFVVMNLVKALQQENTTIISVSCAYLANRHPALLEVHINDHESGLNIEFVDEH